MFHSRSSTRGLRPGGFRRRHDVAMLELSARLDAIRRSKIAFWTVGATVAVITAVIGSAITDPVRAVGLGMVAGALCGLTVGVLLFVWPMLRVAWHWSAELVTLGLFLAAYLHLSALMPWWAALTVLGTVVLVPLLIPPVRRLVVGAVMCAVSRHRLRVCFSAFIASQHSGMTPLILLARPIPAGERVWVWLRPGLALADLEARLDKLAAGCWAAECRISAASRRYSALLRLDIARRNPLGGMVGSPLPGLVPATPTPVIDAHVSTGGLDLPDTPALPAPPPRRRNLATTSEPRALTVDDILAAKPAGDDLTDWI